MNTRHGVDDPPLPGCTCRDRQVDELRELIAQGVDQHTASHQLWGDPTTPAAVRGWVRRQFAATFPWLQLPATTREDTTR